MAKRMCYSILSVAVIIDSDQKYLGGGKDLFDLHSQVTVGHRQKSGQELKQDCETETMGNSAS